MSYSEEPRMETTHMLPPVAQPALRRQNLGQIAATVFPHLVLLAYTAIALFPVVLVVINSFKSRDSIFSVPWAIPTPATFDLVGYQTVFQRASFLQYFLNSAIVTGVAL